MDVLMPLPFSQVATMYEQLEKITSGNKMREILSSFFRKVPKEDMDKVVYLSVGKIASDFEDINFGMAEKMAIKSIAQATKKQEHSLVALFKKRGDLGIVAAELVGKAEGELMVNDIFITLQKIAAVSGTGSQEQKIALLSELLRKASPIEAKYIIRIVLGTMRLGAGNMTILDALAIAYTGNKVNKKKLEQAYNICPDLGVIAKMLITNGLRGIERIGVRVGRPIKMMLASRVNTLQELQEKMSGKIAAEEKYDGERVQIHFLGKKIILYSRRLENITSQFPDIALLAQKQLTGKSYIVEGEIVAVDENGKLLPFQMLMQRRRKYEIQEYAKKIPVCLFLFDLLYLNGKSYLSESYAKRRAVLNKIVKEKENCFMLARQVVSDKLADVTAFFKQALTRGCEGIIAKSVAPHSIYQAGTRGWLWIKWKKEYVKDLSDTFDLVVVGAFMGRGRRKGTYGALLCAAYNEKDDTFETFCKLGSGFRDEQLHALPQQFKKFITPQKPARLVVNKSLIPDVWLEPKIVVEVLGAELTKSPIHTCVLEKDHGIALRFPRFVRFRDDKSPEQATTSHEILQMYKERMRK